jgi:hypothetical protein
MAAMPTFEELDTLSSQELHDRAVHRAKRHLDVRFFWDLMQIAPAAEIAEGDPEQAETEVLHWSVQVGDALKRDPEGMTDGRREYYIDYLMRHGD